MVRKRTKETGGGGRKRGPEVEKSEVVKGVVEGSGGREEQK